MMKIIFFTLFIFFGASQAQEYKAVFDCSSSDAVYIDSRLMVMEKTIDMLEKDSIKANFVLTLHGGCVPMVSKRFTDIIPKKDINHIAKAQETITRLSEKRGIEIIACAMSLKYNAIEQKDVLPFVKISENSFIDTIKYQNLGYALMPLK
jgi:intracellular sulfur oxidation DsrE/DsrF family protein